MTENKNKHKHSKKNKNQKQKLSLTPEMLADIILNNVENNPNIKTPNIQKTLSKNEKEEQKRKIQEISALEPIVSEFLNSFIIVGYNLNGEKVFIGHAKNQQEHDALIEHLRLIFLNIINS